MNPATLLFKSELQVRILALLLLNPERTWTSRELNGRLHASAVSVHRELHRAIDAGLITREAIGRTYLYRAAGDSPLYQPVRLLLERTVGVVPQLQEALERVPGVEAAFIHGSFARARSRPSSDIDLLVLGRADPRLLRRELRRVEEQIGREIDVLAYTPEEFAAIAESGNSLARGIIRGPVVPVVGSADVLKAA